MKHTAKIDAQLVVGACRNFGVNKVVISPGSRNAPLIIEFDVYQDITKYSLVDERSAAFFALGMAQQTQQPVALVCSSGSALLNYYPAIAEAFYSNIPLLVLSADRPKELIDIGDGQTIRQENVFSNHIHFSANLIAEDLHTNKTLAAKAFQILQRRKGPVHINIPFAEPLYKRSETLKIELPQPEKITLENSLLEEVPIDENALEVFAKTWNRSSKKMLIVGVSQPDEMLQVQLDHLAKDPSVIILTENTSNVYNNSFINSIDKLIFPFTDASFQEFKPEILLTIGGMVVSKKIKKLLRDNPPFEHWHVDRYKSLDTYHVLTEFFKVSPNLFFSQFFFLTEEKTSDYQEKWLKLKEKRQQVHTNYLSKLTFSDLQVFSIINKYVPNGIQIQFSNSTAIRYAQLFDWDKGNSIFCNRGTSGIDGSISTAIGGAVASKKQTLLVTGDLSFFYDSNALWNSYIPHNFRIIVVNNNGGGIFRFIPGPTDTESITYFETPHTLSAEHICKMHGLDYSKIESIEELKHALTDFFDESNFPKLLEIFTPREKSAFVLKDYFAKLAE